MIFTSWQPKLSERAVVLMHDTNVREKDFGVWRFWEEISQQYPAFEFLHAYGLGVLAVGQHPPEHVKWLGSGPHPRPGAGFGNPGFFRPSWKGGWGYLVAAAGNYCSR